MMSFGWRPMLSCYASHQDNASGQTSSAQQAMEQASGGTATTTATTAPSCPASPSWFYIGLGLAAFFGLAAGGRK